MTASPGIAELHLCASDFFIEFARTLDDTDWATTVPCTPESTVRDVLSHVSGIPDDALADRLDGVATDPWTAAQVERNAHLAVQGLLDRWEKQRKVFASAIESVAQRRPAFDCLAHDHHIVE